MLKSDSERTVRATSAVVTIAVSLSQGNEDNAVVLTALQSVG